MAGQQLAPYSFNHHILTINGRTMENFGEGDDVIQAAEREDKISDKVGADGNMMPEISANDSVELTVKFLHTAPENDYMEDLLSQFVEGYITGVAVTLYNTRTGKGEVSTTGYIVKRADRNRGTKAADREWKIVVPKLAIQGAMR